MNNVGHDLLDSLLTAVFSGDHDGKMSKKRKVNERKKEARTRQKREEIGTWLGLSTWELCLHFGKGGFAVPLHDLCCSIFDKPDESTSLELRKRYLEEVLCPKILSVSASRCGRGISTTAMACATTKVTKLVFQAWDYEDMEAPYPPLGELLLKTEQRI